MLKLYRRPEAKAAAFREAAILAVVGAGGLNVPEVFEVGRLGERWGIVMSRAPGRSFGEVMLAEPQVASRYLEALARLHLRIHAQAGRGLPALKGRLAANIASAPALPDELRRTLLVRLAAMPEGDRLCHGDFHPFNVLGEIEAPMIIDWLDATCGEPAADVARSYVLLAQHDPGLAEAFVDASAKAGGVTAEAVRQWLPFVAAARLAEGVAGEEAGLLRMAAAG